MATFEMPHHFQKTSKKIEIFTTSTYAIFTSIFKILPQRCHRLQNGILPFLKVSCACGLRELVARKLVGKRGIKADPCKRRGLGFNSSWWRWIP
jgi:hypothetical protein